MMSLFLTPLRPPAVALLANAGLPTFRSQALPSSREGGGVLPGRHSLFAESKGIHTLSIRKSRELPFACFYDTKKDLDNGLADKRLGANWPILSRWDVPWEWQTVLFSMIACGASFALTGLVEAVALPYLGFQGGEVSLDQKTEILFAGQFAVTASVLGVLYGITNTFRPFPNDIFKYDLKEPFDLQNGWLLWAGVGLFGAVIAIALVGFLLNIMNSEQPQRETDALIRLLPLIGSSSISTACLVGITGVLAPLLEETVFRGFFMVSLTKWFPTPVSVLLSAAVFALAHLTPGEFPQLFVLGTALGFSYAQTRNLLTPITIHAFWNSGVILLLTFLQLQGYDIRELLQTS
ncbi:hypothetical protein KFK09_024784 [Dendrobium nobile]|uniref:CAAX prenyl protease 2/Lysostaphin resistance protein A-like domain-containing protein n=1 Tax=Dendrobium nobile TaxID=94219 RepID=A0A8T3AEX4_DENNO|nr:hypothetical protein KFK09_024784 [Dendrobium nobile]